MIDIAEILLKSGIKNNKSINQSTSVFIFQDMGDQNLTKPDVNPRRIGDRLV
jgi:hypothetical protein